MRSFPKPPGEILAIWIFGQWWWRVFLRRPGRILVNEQVQPTVKQTEVGRRKSVLVRQIIHQMIDADHTKPRRRSCTVGLYVRYHLWTLRQKPSRRHQCSQPHPRDRHNGTLTDTSLWTSERWRLRSTPSALTLNSYPIDDIPIRWTTSVQYTPYRVGPAPLNRIRTSLFTSTKHFFLKVCCKA
jgi:hypothetical protein